MAKKKYACVRCGKEITVSESRVSPIGLPVLPPMSGNIMLGVASKRETKQYNEKLEKYYNENLWCNKCYGTIKKKY